MGCCCISDSTVSQNRRSVSNEKDAANVGNTTKISIYKNPSDTSADPNFYLNSKILNESRSNICFESIPYFEEFLKLFENFIGHLNRNYRQNRNRLMDFSNKWGTLLNRIEKTLATPTEKKIKELFHSNLLHVKQMTKYKDIHNGNSIIEERNDEDFEIEVKENSSKENSMTKNKNSAFKDKNNISSEVDQIHREKIIIFIEKAKFFENISKITLPFIQIKIKEDQSQYSKEKNIVFETKKMEKKGVPEWNEYFCKEFEIGKKLDLKKAVFILELFYFDSKSQLMNSLGEKTFSFDEIKDQLVNQKVIKYFNFDKVIAELFIKCQVIFDYKLLLKYWFETIKVKKEISDRLLVKLHQNYQIKENEEEKNIGEISRNNSVENQFLEASPNFIENLKSKESENHDHSILSMDEQSLAQSGYFENQFYVK